MTPSPPLWNFSENSSDFYRHPSLTFCSSNIHLDPEPYLPAPPLSCHTCFRCVCSHSQTGLTVGKWIKVNIEYLPFDKKSDKARLIGLKVKVAQLDSLSALTNIKSNRHGVLHNPPLHNIFCQQAANKQQGKNYAFIWRISHRSKSAHFGKNISVTFWWHYGNLLSADRKSSWEKCGRLCEPETWYKVLWQPGKN